MRLLRSLLFHLLFLLLISCAALITLGPGWLLPLKRRIVITHATEAVMSWLLRWLCGVRVRVHYADKQALDAFRARQRALLIVANHQSQWETFYLQSLFPPLLNVLKRELIRIPLLGWALACYRPVVMHRSKLVGSLRTLQQQGGDRLLRGFNLLLFPQSTRLPPGVTGKISASAAKLAVGSGAVLVPLVHNAGQHWPRRGLMIVPGTINVWVGVPLDTGGASVEQAARHYKDAFQQELEEQLSTGQKATG